MGVTALPARGRPLRVLAVGAHPDDIEIGAGALLCKARADGHEVHLLVMTDGATAGTRRAEATAAAAELGLGPERLHFAGLPDGHLRVDGTVVSHVRQLLSGFRPDVVVVHTGSDSHNDHVETHRTARAAFRGVAFLYYSIHVSCEPSAFAPRVFVEVAGERRDAKQRALAAHRSQQSTIGRFDLAVYEAALGERAGLDRAEGFEIGLQTGSVDLLDVVLGMSESPFHCLWLPLLRDGGAVLLYPPATDAASERQLNAGRDRLRQAFADRWGGLRLPLREVFGDGPDAVRLASGGTVVLVGDPAAHGSVIESWGSDLRTSLVGGVRAGPVGPQDAERGVLTRMVHPLDPAGVVLQVTAPTAAGVRAGLDLLADPGDCPGLGEALTGGRDVQGGHRHVACRNQM